MDYDIRTVHDLVLAIAKEGMLALQRGVNADDGETLLRLEYAIRAAVLLEDSTD